MEFDEIKLHTWKKQWRKHAHWKKTFVSYTLVNSYLEMCITRMPRKRILSVSGQIGRDLTGKDYKQIHEHSLSEKGKPKLL